MSDTQPAKPVSDAELAFVRRHEATVCCCEKAANHVSPKQAEEWGEPERINEARWLATIDALVRENERLAKIELDYNRLHKMVNTPEIIDFGKAVQLEAIFQQEKWGSDHDAGKTDADWFWLIGYLAGKALHNPLSGKQNPDKKRLHRIITVAAAACNWHASVLGLTNMRPGIEPPGNGDQLQGGSDK